MQTQHELQVIGLIPDLENEITFTIAYEDGTVEEKTVSYEMGSLLGTEKVQLSQEDGESQEALEDGLYVVEIVLPEGLHTNYGKTLPTLRELKGTADIILADRNVLERLLAPLRKIVEYED